VNEERIGYLLAGFAHDLRTPLATIFGFAKTIERQGALDDTQGRFLGLIMDAASDMDRMIENLSLVAHVLEGRWTPSLEPASTAALAAAALEAATVRADGRALEAAAGVDGTVSTDPARAPRVLAIVAEAALRLDPGRAVATVAPSADGVRVGPFEPHLVTVVTEPGRDIPVEVARIVLERLGVRLEPDGDHVAVRFPAA
jgi:two-component system sensor histidine kinase KdpD